MSSIPSNCTWVGGVSPSDDWSEACDPVPARREDDGSLRADGAPPKAEKQKKGPRSLETRAKISAALRDPVNRQKYLERNRKGGRPSWRGGSDSISGAIIDSEFDDVGV